MRGKPPAGSARADRDPGRLREFELDERERGELARGVALFNRGSFWLAHEAWEEIWLGRREPGRLFLQGLILAAAGFHRLVEKPDLRGGRANLEKALERLHRFEPDFLGIRVTPLVRMIGGCIRKLRRAEGEGFLPMDRRWIPAIEVASGAAGNPSPASGMDE